MMLMSGVRTRDRQMLGRGDPIVDWCEQGRALPRDPGRAVADQCFSRARCD